MQCLKTNSFTPKALGIHQRYLRLVLFKHHYSNIRKFICRVKKINKYLEKFPLFGTSQGLLDDKIINIIDFSLSCKWKKQITIQVFKFTFKGLNELIEFCDHLKTADKIFQDKFNVKYPKKPKSGGSHQLALLSKSKLGSN